MLLIKVFVEIRDEMSLVGGCDREPKHVVYEVMTHANVFTGSLVAAVGFVCQPVVLVACIR